MGSAFAAALAGTDLLGTLFNSSQNPSTTLLNKSQPAFFAAQNMQAQDTSNNVEAQQQQAMLGLEQSQLVAGQSAANSETTIANQALAYDSSGVQLMGSPMMVLNKSRQLAQQSVNAILAQGQGAYNVAATNAATTADQGRAALVGGQNNLATALAQAKITGSQTQMGAVMQALNQLGMAAGNKIASPFENNTDPNDPFSTPPPVPIHGYLPST